MSRIRSIRPTDVVALATFEGKALPNEAKTRRGLAKEQTLPLAMGTVLEQWIISEDRHTVVAVAGLTIRGLISARHRAGRSIWEVDRLVVCDNEDQEEMSAALLEHLSELASQGGIRSIFLRLPQESPSLQAARRAGFSPYLSETLFRRTDAGVAEPLQEIDGCRPRMNGDDHAIFRLYSAVVPSSVRAVEGMTFEEWRDSQDTASGRRREYLCMQEDRLRAWLRVSRGGGYCQLQLLFHPGEESVLDSLVRYALSRSPQREPVLALVPNYQSSLIAVLTREWAFEGVAHYCTLVRQLTVRVREARLVPARA